MINNIKPIVICDLDGCLNLYPKTFLDWVKAHTGIHKNNLIDLKSLLTKKKYEKLKYIYRTCGVKRNLAVRKGATDTLKKIKKSGKKIWIVTSRPTFEPVKEDTRYWLGKNRITHDRLVFKKEKGKKKYLRKLRNKICFVIEDDPNLAIYFTKKLKIPVFLFDNKWVGIRQNNKNSKKGHSLITNIKSWNDIKKITYD